MSRQENCDTTFRTEISPQCDTVVETVCSNQTVTRTRPDIKEKCTTRVDVKNNIHRVYSLGLLD